MNLLAWLQALDGVTLLAAICALLFLEEAGVPLPFAPGDLLLAITGIAIAAGKVNPVVAPLATVTAIVAGAMVGREVFALLGWGRLMRVAGLLHAGAHLERAGAMLDRAGWRAVFTARVIPGLRVHTTQVAGVRRMRRLTFLRGLVPAAVVYVTAFVGLGAAFGRPILDLIHRLEHQALVLLAVLVALVAAVLWLRGPAQRTLAALGGWTGVFTVRLASPGIILVPACIGLNFAGRSIAVALDLPLFLDSTGTVLCGLVLGPWVGGSVGFITNLLTSNTVDPIAAPYSVVSFAVGFAAGVAGRLGVASPSRAWLALGPACFAIASVLSTPINIALNDGHSGVPLGDAVHRFLLGARLPPLLAAYLGEAAIDLPDKLLTVGLALLVHRGLPAAPAERAPLELDIARPLLFVVGSRHWLRRVLAGGVCLVLLGWLVVPALVFMGYSVAVARAARLGETGLPGWSAPWRKLVEGAQITAAMALWYLPALVLGLPAEVWTDAGGSGVPGGIVGALGVAASLWSLVVLLLLAPIWSQYLDGGFRAAFDLAAIARRVRVNLGLTLVVAAMGVVLSMLAAAGFALVLVGAVFTVPLAGCVAAALAGVYCRITDERPAGAPGVAAPPAGADR